MIIDRLCLARSIRRRRRHSPDSVRHYDPSQPRDWHGRWDGDGGGGGSSASAGGHVVKDIDARMDEVIKGGKHIGESEQCVALVKELAPEVGRAADWEEGARIKSYGDPLLERGTAIATFKNGKPGIWVLDQSTGKPPRKSHKSFGKSAEYYSVIKRK